ncbi:MAG: DUF3800 domain-containing protein [Candidatus Micrarchaeota archaeon]|nr:DUF3800 domain-containing protein [Candidatus Micrarchaeota archaeon]
MANQNHIKFLFMDESGDLGKLGSRYFTVAVVAVHDPLNLSRIIKRLRERKLKKKMHELSEIKANNSNDLIKRFVLEKVNACDCSISALVISKDKVKDDLFEHKDKLYNYLCGLLLEQITLNVDSISITIDKRETNRLLREDFDRYVERKIKAKSPSIVIKIQHIESYASNELQVVDFIAWSIQRKYAFGDPSFYDLIQNKIRNKGNEEIWK